MDILTLIDSLCLIFGVVGVILAIYFYQKSKNQAEITARENQNQLLKIENTVNGIEGSFRTPAINQDNRFGAFIFGSLFAVFIALILAALLEK